MEKDEEGRLAGMIVAHIGMPDEDGYALVKHPRRIEQERHTARTVSARSTFARAKTL